MQPNNPLDQNQSAPQQVPVVIAPSQPVVVSSEPAGMPGAATQPQFAVTQPELPSSNAGSKNVVKAGLALVLLAVVAVGGLFGWGAYSRHQANVTARAFIAAVNKGDSNEAFALSSKTLQSQNDPLKFADTMDGLQTKSPKFATEAMVIKGTKASYMAVEGNLPADANGSTDATFTVALVRSGLGWKVDGVDVE